MRPSSPLSLLLFTHLISAAPFPNLRPDYSISGIYQNDHTDNPAQKNFYLDQPVAASYSAFNKPDSQAETPVMESVSAREMDSSSKTITSNDAAYVDTIVFAAAQYPNKNWRTQQESQADNSTRALSWTRVSWTGTRQDSELLVVGIVVLFVIALIAWETIGRLERLWMVFRCCQQRRGPIFLSDDEEGVIALGNPNTMDQALPQEKRHSGEGHLHRWGEKPSCCADDKNSPCTCSKHTEHTKLSTSTLISKCVRGVCES